MAGRLAGKRILVVEDDYFIAQDLRRALLEEDAVVIGPIGRVDEELSFLNGDQIDAAVLDMNLGQPMTSLPLADQLASRGVPCMFVTGYDTWSMPPAYRDAPRVTKPFSKRAVLNAVVDLVCPEKS